MHVMHVMHFDFNGSFFMKSPFLDITPFHTTVFFLCPLKTSVFLAFSGGGIEREQLHEMSQNVNYCK